MGHVVLWWHSSQARKTSCPVSYPTGESQSKVRFQLPQPCGTQSKGSTSVSLHAAQLNSLGSDKVRGKVGVRPQQLVQKKTTVQKKTKITVMPVNAEKYSNMLP